MIKLGVNAKDSISGFEGVVTGRCVYLHYPPKIELTSRLLNNCTPVGSQWFSESQVTECGDQSQPVGFKPPTEVSP